MATNLNIDDVTYEVKKDETVVVKEAYPKNYFICAGFPLSEKTDNMSYREAQKVAKAMRQLGFTVIDRRE